MKYDVFISYRRDGGAQYARVLQLMLEKRGYHVFLDYDELKDGFFRPEIQRAIEQSVIFMLVLSKNALDRCSSEEDWVLREIRTALDNRKRIVPVNPDGVFTGIPNDVPVEVREAIEGTQYSEVNFGQALNATVDLLVKNRISPYVRKISLRRRMMGASILLLVIIVAGVVIGRYVREQRLADRLLLEAQHLAELKESVRFESLTWSDNVTLDEVNAVKALLETLQLIPGGTFMMGAAPLPDGTYDESVEPDYEVPAHLVEVEPFWMGKFEVTLGQWNAIMHDQRDGEPMLPVSNVTVAQCDSFCARLLDLTLLEFRLPSEPEWEYAARGGNEPEGYLYAGGDVANDVAWYAKNAQGHCHSDRKAPTVNDLFDMSGNLSEWCSTDFTPYNKELAVVNPDTKVVRGGNYESPEWELTVYHREPMMPTVSAPTVGFRIALSK